MLLVVMCKWAPDTDRVWFGSAMRGFRHAGWSAWSGHRPGLRLPCGLPEHGGLQEITTQRSAYESAGSGSIAGTSGGSARAPAGPSRAAIAVSGPRRPSCGRCPIDTSSGTVSVERAAHRGRDQLASARPARPAPPRTPARRGPAAASATAARCGGSRSSHREHRDLDDVGGRALDRRVQRHPLGHLPALPVVRGQVGQVAAAAEHRLGVAVRRACATTSLQVVAHPAELLRSTRPCSPRASSAGDPQLLGQPVGRQPVGQAVVHRLDLGAQLRGRRRRAPRRTRGTRSRRGSRARS